MAVIYEDFIRCSCGNFHFAEQKQVTIHKKVLERTDKSVPISSLSEEYVYVCTECGSPLAK